MERSFKAVVIILSIASAFFFSPFMIRHKCGLSSFAIELGLTLSIMLLATLAVIYARKKIIIMVIPVCTLLIMFVAEGFYSTWLHSDSFPYSLLDKDIKKITKLKRD